jgi:hypothetical protein
MFSFDGIYTEVNADGATAYGAWKSTGADTAELTALSNQTNKDGTFVGTLTIRVTITVSALRGRTRLWSPPPEAKPPGRRDQASPRELGSTRSRWARPS